MRLRLSKLLVLGVLASALLVTAASAAITVFAAGMSTPESITPTASGLFVTDAPSRIVTIGLRTDRIVSEVSTGGAPGLRADEVAFDPVHNLLLPVNNADSPPFASLIKVDPATGKLTLLTRITFENATNGAEQPIFNRSTGKFYISIPEVDGITANGAVGVISTSGVMHEPRPAPSASEGCFAGTPRSRSGLVILDQARTSLTTLPKTSVRRKSRPA